MAIEHNNPDFNRIFQPYVNWFVAITQQLGSGTSEQTLKPSEIPAPKDNPLSGFLEQNNFPGEYRVTLLLLMFEYYFPELMVPFLKIFSNEQTRGMIGGSLCERTKLYEPSLQTTIFLMSGADTGLRLNYSVSLEEENNALFTDGIIDYKYENNRGLRAPLKLNGDFRLALIGQTTPRMDSGENFPARLAETKLDYSEVILSPITRQELDPLMRYLKVRKQIKENEELKKLVKPC